MTGRVNVTWLTMCARSFEPRGNVVGARVRCRCRRDSRWRRRESCVVDGAHRAPSPYRIAVRHDRRFNATPRGVDGTGAWCGQQFVLMVGVAY
jgi:hypothetical protein